MERTRKQRKSEDNYSQDDAEAIWSIAAKLQSEAQERLEERSKVISTRYEEDDKSSPLGFEENEVRSIAEEAGISAEFVDLALMKSRTEKLMTTRSSTRSWLSRLVSLDRNAAEKSLTIDLPIDKVYDAMRRVFPSTEFGLHLADVIGDGSPGDTILGFSVPGVWTATGVHSFGYRMSHTDVKSIFASLHPISENQCQVSLRAEHKTHTEKAYFFLSLGLSIFIAGLISLPISFEILNFGGLQAVGLWAATTAIFNWIGLKGFRRVHLWGLKKTKEAMLDLLKAVKVDAITDGSFSAPPLRPESKENSDNLIDLFGKS